MNIAFNVLGYQLNNRFTPNFKGQQYTSLAPLACDTFNFSGNTNTTLNLKKDVAKKEQELNEKLSDDDFEDIKELIYIPKRKNNQFSTSDILLLSDLSPKSMARAKQLVYLKDRYNDQLSAKDIYNLAKLKQNEYNNIKPFLSIPQRKNDQLKGDCLILLAKIPKERLIKYHYIPERKDKQLKAVDILYTDNFNPAAEKTFDTIVKDPKHINDSGIELYLLSIMRPEYRENYINRGLGTKTFGRDKKLPASDAMCLSQLDNKGWKKLLKSGLLTLKVPTSQFYKDLGDNKQIISIIKDETKNTDSEKRYLTGLELTYTANLRPFEINNFKKLLKIPCFETQKVSTLSILSKLNNKELNNVKSRHLYNEYFNLNIPQNNALSYAMMGYYLSRLSDEKYKTYRENELNTLRGTPEIKYEVANMPKDKLIAASSKLNNLIIQTFKNPDLYTNGNINKVEQKQKLTKFFQENGSNIMLLSSIADKETLNTLMRKRISNFQKYLDMFEILEPKDRNLLGQAMDSTTFDSKPLMPTQKIDLINVLYSYESSGTSTRPITKMVKTGKIDIGALKKNLLYNILRQANLTDRELTSIPKEKLYNWDLAYTPLLSQDLNSDDNSDCNNKGLEDVILHATTDNNFMNYIQDTNNEYGKINANTKKAFNDVGINDTGYKKWLQPSESDNVTIRLTDAKTKELHEIGDVITNNIEFLRKTPIKTFIDKQYKNNIKDGKFVIPDKVLNNRSNLYNFTSGFTNALNPVWKRATSHINTPEKKDISINTLSVKSNLIKATDSLNILKTKESGEKPLDITIKMWDRAPQKDLFQGNYSTCCIGAGESNSAAQPHYLLNTALNMIEVVDNTSGKTVGNSLCYYAKNKDKKPVFILDNIEINNNFKPSDEICGKIRDGIVQYAQNLNTEVTNDKNTPIYMGPDYNDVPSKTIINGKTVSLPKVREDIEFLGNIDSPMLYLDCFSNHAEWSDTNKLKENRPLYLLNGTKQNIEK